MPYAIILLGLVVLITNLIIGARYGQLYKADNNTLEEN